MMAYHFFNPAMEVHLEMKNSRLTLNLSEQKNDQLSLTVDSSTQFKTIGEWIWPILSVHSDYF